MNKVSTVAAKRSRKISEQKLTVGLDLGDRSSWYCVPDESGGVLLEQSVATSAKALARGVRQNAAQPHRAGDRDALSVGEPSHGQLEN